MFPLRPFYDLIIFNFKESDLKIVFSGSLFPSNILVSDCLRPIKGQYLPDDLLSYIYTLINKLSSSSPPLSSIETTIVIVCPLKVSKSKRSKVEQVIQSPLSYTHQFRKSTSRRKLRIFKN